jgi:RimJ/RimL family protein N-acetyltransferase
MRPTLADAGILVRPFAADDVGSLYAAVRESIDTVGRWMSWCHPDYSIREAEEWIARCEKNWEAEADREFGIFDAKSNEALGCAGINQINRIHNFANLGYWVRASRAGKGVGSAVAMLLAKFAFGELKLSRIEIVTMLDNAASRRVAEKVGFQFEGVARNRLLFKGQPHDAALYSLVLSDING